MLEKINLRNNISTFIQDQILKTCIFSIFITNLTNRVKVSYVCRQRLLEIQLDLLYN